MPDQQKKKSTADRIEQGAFRWAKENTEMNQAARKRFARDMRRAYHELPLEFRGSIEMALFTAERRGTEGT